VKKLTTETGAGQWGASLSFACSLFDMECEIFQVGGCGCGDDKLLRCAVPVSTSCCAIFCLVCWRSAAVACMQPRIGWGGM